ncbi:MAG: hypothetical protein RLZZ352_1458 [Pseudomonadota bacterium]
MFPERAAKMQLASDGFLRPVQLRELSDQEAKQFNAVCPGVTVQHKTRGPEFHTLWGPIVKLQTGFATDEEVRFKGSSGGVLSALAIYLLESGKVNGVLHIAPDDQEPFTNRSQISQSRSDVLNGAGSRYAPASPLDRVRECLNTEGVFAFIGKPCDVAALRAMSHQFPAVTQKFPYMLSFMCAGTPSLQGTHEVVKHLGFEPDQVVKFRYRGNGWPGMARAETADGRFSEMDYDSSWGQILNRHLQFRCKICPDGTGEFADVSCADAWHSDEKGYPVFTETSGRSLIVARTKTGQQLVDALQSQKRLDADSIAVAEVSLIQPYQKNRKQALLSRMIGFRMGGQKVSKYSNFDLLRASAGLSLRSHLKNAVGSWLRATGLKKSSS